MASRKASRLATAHTVNEPQNHVSLGTRNGSHANSEQPVNQRWPDALPVHPAAQIDNPALIEHATEIRRLGKRVIEDVIEIGRRLIACKAMLDHGQWLPWLDREF